MKTEKATFAAGCFWHVEAALKQVKGVTGTTVGYTGGDYDNPAYEDVCGDRTGHAEAVEVVFAPQKISYQKLLEIFWRVHDPTQFNRQGPDIGSQYRSVIFYHNQKQKDLAESSLKNEQKKHAKPVATHIVKASKFWPAEEYHQDYYEKHKLAACATGMVKRL